MDYYGFIIVRLLEFIDSISDSTNGFYLERIANFFSKIFDVCIDSSVIDILIISDDILHEGFSFDDSFAVPDEVFQECEFCLGEPEFSSIKCRNMTFCIDRNFSKSQEF